MKLALLGERIWLTNAPGNPHYRGTYRESPYSDRRFGKDHPVTHAYNLYLYDGGRRDGSDAEDFGIVTNVETARTVCKVFRELNGQHYDIVELTADDASPSVGGEFLGFDVSYKFGHSMLWQGINMCPADGISRDFKGEDWEKVETIIAPLACLIDEHFRPQLNLDGLFDSYETAQRFLDCMNAIHKLHPEWCADMSGGYEVVGLYKVSEV
ncbi:MAG TPA: hypothetical protein VND68_02245 [Chloroflexia bacterium]|jgi:hypothetical protein|nr:hypothetical protein [Chloroflexia bacterium]